VRREVLRHQRTEGRRLQAQGFELGPFTAQYYPIGQHLSRRTLPGQAGAHPIIFFRTDPAAPRIARHCVRIRSASTPLSTNEGTLSGASTTVLAALAAEPKTGQGRHIIQKPRTRAVSGTVAYWTDDCPSNEGSNAGWLNEASRLSRPSIPRPTATSSRESGARRFDD